MRSMSFSLTTRQFLEGTKTVTRRLGWKFLQPGDRIRAVERAMGLKKGEHPRVLGVIEIVSVRREKLDAINDLDCVAEGFPYLDAAAFVRMFVRHMGCLPDAVVTRIKFRKVAP